MKKFAVLISALLICLMLPVMASAMTQEEWNQKCRDKTSETITLYAIESEAGDSTSSTDVSASIKEIGSLPGGTYIMISGYDYDLRMYKVAYLSDGNVEVAWSPKESAIVSATTAVYFDDGSTDALPEALVADIDALLRRMNTVFPDRTYSAIPGSSKIHVEYSRSSVTPPPVKDPNKGTSRKGKGESFSMGQKSGPSTMYKENGEVTVEELGTYMSKVSYQGKSKVVPTVELSFGKGVPEDKKLAVIYTPKTGKASLRKSASGNADMLKQCKAGTLVAVLEYGSTYTMISYKNTIGYIQTDCLKFHSAAAETEGKGMLSYNGKVSGGTTINIRLAADGGSRKIGEFRTGTEVTIIKYGDEWCEIEVGGRRGFVMTEFLLKN